MRCQASLLNVDQNQIAQLRRLKGIERALVTKLLQQVQDRVQDFVNGKYIEPLTLRYDGEGSATDVDSPGNHATFVCFPYFDYHPASEICHGRDTRAHRTRALLQTKSRLECTSERDGNQVITKNNSLGPSGLIHVPQIWALVVNDSESMHSVELGIQAQSCDTDLLVTCAPCEASILRGHSISTIRQSQAMTDEEAWSIQYYSISGIEYFIPVRQCRSWFVC